ncbi:MAG: hypothetical protein K6L80_04805 [Agarilytica sp.]
MSDTLVFAFIFVALGIGYVIGKYLPFFLKQNTPSETHTSNRRYFDSLTFLLKEETDEAIDLFISDMEVNDNTLDVHLSLGSMLRRKGELARAVKVHENLLSHSELSASKHNIVQFELANDYIQSGLYDRAEQLLNGLAGVGDIDKSLRHSAMESLVDVYQATHDWLKAIDIADQLTGQKFSKTPDRWRVMQSHFSCELALLAQQNDDEPECSKWIRNALHYDTACVRATLLQAQLDMKSGITHAAMAALKSVSSNNPQFATEMIAPLHECYIQLNSEQDYIPVLRDYLDQHADVRALGLLFELVSRYASFENGMRDLSVYLPKYPEFTAINKLGDVLCELEGNKPDFLDQFRPVFDSILEAEVVYACSDCGFVGHEMHWACPGCHHWASTFLHSDK